VPLKRAAKLAKCPPKSPCTRWERERIALSPNVSVTLAPPRRERRRSLAFSAAVEAQKGEVLVKELARYLLENMYLDFQGEITLDKVRQFLREDDSRESKTLLAKLIEDKGVNELLITLADVLKDHIQAGVNDQTIREQLQMYSES
jgi:hypothetical protein